MLSSRSLTVVALSLAMVLIGINSQSGWLFWLAGLLLAALLVSWLESLLLVRNLEAERSLPPSAVEGESLEVELRVRNGGRFSRHLLAVVDTDPGTEEAPARFSLKARRRSLGELWREAMAGGPDEDGDEGRDAGGSAILLLPRLAGGQETVLRYRRGGLRRGLYRDWPLYFYTEGTLGLSRHSSRIAPPSRLEVHPSYVELSSFPFLDALLYPRRELLPVASRGDGMDFYGVREYRTGDPLERIHWRSTARRGELVIREFEAEKSNRLVILLDNRAQDLGGWRARDRLDHQARVAASIAAYARAAGCPVTLAACRGTTLVTFEAPGLRAALGWLAALRPEGELDPREQLERLLPGLPGVALVCQVTAVDSASDLVTPPSMPGGARLALILVTGPERDSGSAGSSAAGILPDLGSREGLELPPYMLGIALCPEGEDIGKCLENPCAGCADWRHPGR